MWLGFPGGSAGKESACNAGDLGSIPGLGRSPGEGKGYPVFWPGEFHGLYSPWGCKEPDTTEWLLVSRSLSSTPENSCLKHAFHKGSIYNNVLIGNILHLLLWKSAFPNVCVYHEFGTLKKKSKICIVITGFSMLIIFVLSTKYRCHYHCLSPSLYRTTPASFTYRERGNGPCSLLPLNCNKVIS